MDSPRCLILKPPSPDNKQPESGTCVYSGEYSLLAGRGVISRVSPIWFRGEGFADDEV